MHLLVRSLDRMVSVEASATATVQDLLALAGVAGTASVCGNILEPSALVGECLTDDDMVVASHAMLGGKPKKRKAKVYATKKTVPHKHKVVKLAALKFYDVKGDAIKRTRTECPTCGAGVFMAKHTKGVNPRETCGRCGLTQAISK